MANKNLKILADLDDENAVVFEKLGSSYYMMNQKQKAIESWQTAAYLNPKQNKLRNLIKTVQKQIEYEAKARYERQKAQKVARRQRVEDPMSIGVFRSRGAANEFAEQYLKQSIPTQVMQREDQKWEVQVSRKALQKAQKNKKGPQS